MCKRSFTNRMKDLFQASRGLKKSPLKERRLAVEPLETRTLLAIVSMTASAGNPTSIIERDGGSCTVTFAIEAEGDENLEDAGQVSVSYSIGGLDSYEYNDGGCGDGTVTIWADQGQTSATVTVDFFNDAIADGDDTCTITLSGAEGSNPYGGGDCCGDGCWCGDGGGGGDGISFSVAQGQQPATVTIQDDDGWAILVEADTPDEIVERDGASGYSISRVDDGSGRSGDTTYAIAVDFTMSGAADYGSDYHLSGDSGSAIPSDWNATTEQWEWHVTIPPGSGGVGVGLGSVNDAAREADEDATLSIADATSTNNWDDGGCCGGGCMTAAYHGPDETFGQAGPDASVTIQDDDGWALEIERTSGEVIVERTGEASLVLRRVDDGDGRSGDTSYGILVDLDPSGGAAAYGTDFGLYDEDGYYLGYWTATIPAGATATGLQLVSNNDHLWEADEDAVIAVTGGTSVGVSGGVFAAGQAYPDASVLILDDDHWVVTLEEAGEAGDPHTVIQEESQTSAGLLLSRTHEVMTPSRTGDTSYPIDVTFAYSGHASASDYTMVEEVTEPDGTTTTASHAGGTTSFQIQEGQTQKAIEVKAVDDSQVERLNESLVIQITDAVYGSESYSVSTAECEVELIVRDNDKLELYAMGFLGDEDLHSDPTLNSLTGVSWQNGYNWHADRILGNDPDTDYVPVAYSSGDTASAGAFWRPANVDPAITGDLFAFFEVDINGVRYSNIIPMVQRPNGVWVMNAPASLLSSFTGMWGQTARYRPEFISKWYIFVGADAAQSGGINPQDGLSPDEQEAIRHTGDAESCLYVTYSSPVTSPLYHTVVHTGCEAADGIAGTETAVFESIWSEFEGRSINKVNIEGGAIVDGDVLSYYGKSVEDPSNYDIIKAGLETRISDSDADGDWDLVHIDQWPTRAREFASFELTTPEICLHICGLLIKADGTCGAWKEMAMSVFGAQGITTVRKGINPSTDNVQFRVMNDKVGQGGVIPGEKIFESHAVIEYAGKVYDPSYGVEYGLTADALGVFATHIADLGILYYVNGYIPDLDASLVSELDTLRYSWTESDGTVHDVVRVTIDGYGYIYEPTETSPTATDFEWD